MNSSLYEHFTTYDYGLCNTYLHNFCDMSTGFYPKNLRLSKQRRLFLYLFQRNPLIILVKNSGNCIKNKFRRINLQYFFKIHCTPIIVSAQICWKSRPICMNVYQILNYFVEHNFSFCSIFKRLPFGKKPTLCQFEFSCVIPMFFWFMHNLKYT